MKINIAKSAGFCFGVKRAVDTVYKESSKKNVYTFGPIIHNEEVIKDMEKKGVEVILSEEELKKIKTARSLSLFQKERLLFVLMACQKQFMRRSLMRVLI